MAVFKRNGRWAYRVVVRMPDGSKRRISGVPNIDTKADALTEETAHIKRTLEGPKPEENLAPLFKDFVVDWLKTQPKVAGNRASTIEQKTLHVKRHLVPALGEKRLDEITNRVISDLIATLREKIAGSGRKETRVRKKSAYELAREKGPRPLSPRTVRKIIQTLHKALTTAVEWDLIPALPHFPRWEKMAGAEFAFYQRAETDRMIAMETDAEARAALMLAVKTGLRQGEQTALTWDDLDFHGAKVIVRRASRKGGETTGTKTGKTREVPLAKSLIDALKGIRHLRGPLVFCDEHGHALKPWAYKTMLRRAARRAGLRVLRWHDLRHSFASQLVIAGVQLALIQNWLGHATITMTMRYAHLAPGSGAEQINVLDEPVAAAG